MSYRVAVTGASGYIGSRLLERLNADPDVEAIVAIDHNPLPAKLDVLSGLRGERTGPESEDRRQQIWP